MVTRFESILYLSPLWRAGELIDLGIPLSKFSSFCISSISLHYKHSVLPKLWSFIVRKSINLPAFLSEKLAWKKTITAIWNYVCPAVQWQFVRRTIFDSRYFSPFITACFSFQAYFVCASNLWNHAKSLPALYFCMEMEFYWICCSVRFYVMFCKRAERYSGAIAFLFKSPQGGELSVMYWSESFPYIWCYASSYKTGHRLSNFINYAPTFFLVSEFLFDLLSWNIITQFLHTFVSYHA